MEYTVFHHPQAIPASGKMPPRYDRGMSASAIYAYAANDPVNQSDANGHSYADSHSLDSDSDRGLGSGLGNLGSGDSTNDKSQREIRVAQARSLLRFFSAPTVPLPKKRNFGLNPNSNAWDGFVHNSSPTDGKKETASPNVSADGQATSGDPDDDEPKKTDPAKKVDPNKAEHIFGKKNLSKHNLEKVLEAFKGDKAKALQALEDSLKGNVDPTKAGYFETKTIVAGEQVSVEGYVVNGVARIGTAYIPR